MNLKVIDIAHNCSFEHFCEFRKVLAKLIGIDLEEYSGFSSTGTKDPASIEHAIMPLFTLSDQDAILMPKNSRSINLGLEEISKTMDMKKFFFEYGSTNYLELIKYFKDICWRAAMDEKLVIVEFDTPLY